MNHITMGELCFGGVVVAIATAVFADSIPGSDHMFVWSAYVCFRVWVFSMYNMYVFIKSVYEFISIVSYP